jgi:hypothetical protein
MGKFDVRHLDTTKYNLILYKIILNILLFDFTFNYSANNILNLVQNKLRHRLHKSTSSMKMAKNECRNTLEQQLIRTSCNSSVVNIIYLLVITFLTQINLE